MTRHADLPTTFEEYPVVAVVFGPDEDGGFIAVKPGSMFKFLSGFGRTPEDAVRELGEVLDGVDDLLDEMERNA